MESRMNKYYTEEIKKEAKRTTKNAPLYRQIYGAYDEFENYKLPVEDNEIDITNIKSTITSREEYRKMKEYGHITNKNATIASSPPKEEGEKTPRIYDVNELLSRAKQEKKETSPLGQSKRDYLHTLQTDDEIKTNLEKVKEMYEKVKEEEFQEEEQTDTSFDLLSDLKSDNGTEVMPPFKEDTNITSDKIDTTIDDAISKTFYGDKNEFSKDDFSDDNFFEDDLNKKHYLLKSILIVLLIFAVVIVILYLLNRSGIVDLTNLYKEVGNG